MQSREPIRRTRESVVGRALGDPRRAAILETLRRDPDGLDVQELACRTRVHPNTVRWHLGVLADAGLISSCSAGVHGPGRPRVLYRPRPGSATTGRDEHRMLAALLAGTVAAMDDGPERARDAGREWGRHLTDGLPEAGEEAAVETLVEVLAREGFEPEASGLSILMRRCPFHDLAEAHPDVVCASHHGLVCGVLEELGSPLRVRTLHPFVLPELCVLELEADPARSPSRPRPTRRGDDRRVRVPSSAAEP